MKFRTIRLCAAAVWGLGVVMAPLAAWSAPDVSIRYFATGGGGGFLSPTISDDGRYVAYRDQSSSSIFILDVQTGERIQANRTLTGSLPTNPTCDVPAMSADARYVVYGCLAAPMGGRPSFGTDAYFVYDRLSDSTEMLQVPDAKRVARTTMPAISADGRYIAFRGSDSAGNYSLYIRDMVNKTTVITNPANVYVGVTPNTLSISDDGRYVSYSGRPVKASSLEDISVYDTGTGGTEAINVSSLGVHGTKGGYTPVMSGDGNIVVYRSTDAALVSPKASFTNSGIFVRDRHAGTTEFISTLATVNGLYNSMNRSGRYVAFVADMQRSFYVYDRLTKVSRIITGAYTSSQLVMGSAFSSDGRYLVFQARGTTSPVADSIGVVDLGAAAGLALSVKSVALTEGGAAGTYTAVLTQAPTANVNVVVKPDAQVNVARTQLVFTPDNWNVPQVVSVQAIQDSVAEGAHTGTIIHTLSSADVNYTVVPAATVTVSISDAVIPTVVVPASIWTQTAMPLTGTAAPGATVLLTWVNQNSGMLHSISVMADAQGHWSYILTDLIDGVYGIDAQADGIQSTVQMVTVKLPAPLVDVTNSIRTTAYGLILNRSTGKFAGNFTLTNIGSTPLAGPLQLQFDGLTAGVSLFNSSGSHGGSPYLTLPNGLTVGEAVTIGLLFENPARAVITYTAKIYSGNL